MPETANAGVNPHHSLPDPAGHVHCYHCNEVVPPGTDIPVVIDGELYQMCCYGCQAVAQTIVDYGLTEYYRYRTQAPKRPDAIVPGILRNLDVYDDTRIQESFVEITGENIHEASLLLEGMVCPACVWLTESRLNRMPGVISAKINYNTNRMRICWDNSRVHLSAILETISSLGFSACPYNPGQREAALKSDRKNQLFRIGLSGLLGMQVMMISVALYAGDWGDSDLDYRFFLQWTNLILTTPVVLYCAQPFFMGAFRDFRHMHFGMDIPVSLGILIAYTGSIEATITRQGTIYYDSIVMFVFLLLLARYLEFTSRKYAGDQISILERILPATATRIKDGQTGNECIPVIDLNIDDRVLVRPGETIPADAVIVDGRSTVNESIITGESMPVLKNPGDEVIAGSTNVDSPVILRIVRIGNDSTVSRIGKLLEQAQNSKPSTVELANIIACWFVAFVLLIAVSVAWYWWQTGVETWLGITISVLVVSCPCALSLAAPTAITAATVTLMRKGIAVTTHDAVENLARASHFILDKTGTLTFGKLEIISIEAPSDMSREECIAIAATIEQHSEHPVAMAIASLANSSHNLVACDVINSPGQGISGIIGGRRYFLGTPAYISASTGLVSGNTFQDESGFKDRTLVILADEKSVYCRFIFSDQIRPSAGELIQCINKCGGKTIILSGDHAEIVDAVARKLDIKEAFSDLQPDAKLAILEAMKNKGFVTAAIGDGINDAPVLAAAHVSVAMGKGTDIARINADMILINDRLDILREGILIARQTYTIIKQNTVWAIGYNLLALPAAATGLLTPWMAAIGMSLSSILVIGNASRILKS